MKEVATPSKAQAALEAKRRLPRTLCEGTEAMRAAGTTYLPKHPAESQEAWECRKNQAVLLPAYRDAEDLACALIFRKPVTAGEGVPEEAKPWLDDIDRTGLNVTQFAEDVMRDALKGVSFIVVDYPRVSPGLTRAQEQAIGARPYFIHVKAEQVLGWRTQQVAGQTVLTQFRYRETATEVDGAFGEKTAERIRVLELGMVQVYVKVEGKDDWILDTEASGMVTMPKVAVVPVYTGRRGFMEGVPPLLDLAWKNVEHWQSASDQRNILHVARVPILKLIGADDGDVIVGPQNVLKLPMGGDAGWIEMQSGESVKAGRQDLEDLKEEMQRQAGRILDKQGDKTAREAGIESTQSMSRVQAWAHGLNAAMNAAWALCGEWIGQDLGKLVVNTDVDTARPDAPYLTEIRNATAAGLLSKETYLRILQDAEVLPEGFDMEQELDRLEKEAPDLLVTPPAKKTPKKKTVKPEADGSYSVTEE